MRKLIFLSILAYFIAGCRKNNQDDSYISFLLNGQSRTTKNISPSVQGNELNTFSGSFSDGTSIGFNLYALSSQQPGNYSFRESNMLPAQLGSFAAESKNYKPDLKWTTISETNLSRFEIERSFDGSVFTKIGEVSATNTSSLVNYEYLDTGLTTIAKAYYRLKVIESNGQFSYSSVIAVVIIYVAYYGEGSEKFKGYNGSFEIISYDRTKHILTGNFSFDIKNNSGQTETIRNGNFRIKY